MNFKRFFAVVKARNIEFFRDRSSLGWNLFFPILMLAGLSFVFSGDGKAVYKVGVIDSKTVQSSFMETRYVDFIDYQDKALATVKLEQHAIDFLVDFSQKSYWVNQGSPNSYLVEKIFLGQHNNFQRLETYGKKIRYVDWVLPGILGMNMMFSCLFGVGYVIVRYRKNAVLKRLKATPLSAFEFVSAQLVSRIFIVMFMSSVVYIGCNFFFDFYMLGSYFDLFIIAVLGAISLISLGLLVASRSKSEELIGGLLNLTSWPMMLLSGVWFSLEGAPNAVKVFADFLPLTHLVAGARKVITEGATLADISYHLSALLIMSTIFLALGSYLFSWNTER
ncbi:MULTISPECIES: ABC transporter permease [unclassified Colwellia]|uniref:ABC transporter permease n=1 Tax=unclassified Colwellia TaxID=196834 RepID=UPI0015F59911|nr:MULTISPECIES: ABC transporter permease [unclassified Colwellia]MBA6349425.1 ABC transporter permease [Colwellia sp. BRX8-9]MBA6353554.1 ABC transporter permease [Colwellia sp. BRX9-1]MBA6357209.1 ABC transporter permease [Colwellia sp. BRX8-3]MBA6360693.1 ABC transporter permease [Colwellia sp. BRX8-6]MBA6368699.1 ABC transporter permease [Colwellia sp. BRX8-5]|tara:strand:+ start:1194 stop:2198 length:1005 start_codon:yes stop_codon:yes gene_type:complete